MQPEKYAVDQIQRVTDTLRTIHQRSQKLEYLFIISPEKIRSETYGLIKKVGETELGIWTQCVLRKNIEKGAPDFYTNLLLKVNAKLGGINFKLADNTFLSVPTILFGADVTHPAPGSNTDTPSVAAVVYSMDKEGFQYNGEFVYQTGRVEMIQNLEEMVLQGLMEYQQNLMKSLNALSSFETVYLKANLIKSSNMNSPKFEKPVRNSPSTQT